MTALAETIAAQPDLLAEALEIDLGDAQDRLLGAERIWLVGTGTSQHAAELGALMLREGGKQAYAFSSASFARFGPAPEQNDAAIVISHTGGTAFAKRARAQALSAGAHLIAITGRGAGWEGAIETIDHERAETYTASYTAVLVLLARLAGVDAERLAEVPERARAAVDDPGLEDVPADLRLLAFAGAGPASVTAREAALKVREGARLLAEGYEAEYLLHGSAVPLNEQDGLVLVDPDADGDGLVAGVGNAAAAAGLRTWTTAEPPGMHPVLAQIPLTIRLQWLASRLADEVGADPDTVIVAPWRDDDLWELGAPEAAE
jgi:glucosamine--fructose-6-phosphate aminotransferase (isomerizing)